MSVTHIIRPKGKYATTEWVIAELGKKSEKTDMYIHKKSGTVHRLTGEGVNIKFKATASFADGDTWLVNGAAVAAKTVDGQGLHTGDIVAGSVVLATVDGGVLWLQIRSYHSQMLNKAEASQVALLEDFKEFRLATLNGWIPHYGADVIITKFGNTAHITGVLMNGLAAANVVMFVVPPDLRPSVVTRGKLLSWYSESVGYFEVNVVNGEVSMHPVITMPETLNPIIDITYPTV